MVTCPFVVLVEMMRRLNVVHLASLERVIRPPAQEWNPTSLRGLASKELWPWLFQGVIPQERVKAMEGGRLQWSDAHEKKPKSRLIE